MVTVRRRKTHDFLPRRSVIMTLKRVLSRIATRTENREKAKGDCDEPESR
jgi:hypothetical protein